MSKYDPTKLTVTEMLATTGGGRIGINIADHYWVIGSSTTEVYSSKSNTMVPTDNADYLAWTAGGGATPIGTEAELRVVLQGHGAKLPAWLLNNQPSFIQPTPTTYTKPQLKSYSADARWRRENSGIIVTSISPIAFLTDFASRNAVNSAFAYTKEAGGTQTVQWKMSDGSFVLLDDAKILKLMNSISTYLQSCFNAEQSQCRRHRRGYHDNAGAD